jgi:hypothetical protein
MALAASAPMALYAGASYAGGARRRIDRSHRRMRSAAPRARARARCVASRLTTAVGIPILGLVASFNRQCKSINAYYYASIARIACDI